MIIQDIRDEIVAEVGQDSEDTTMLANMLTFIKSALRKIPRHVKDRTITTISYATLSAGDYSMDLPSNFIRERRVWRMESGNRKEIGKLPFDTFATRINEDSSGPVSSYRIYGKTIEFDVKTASDEVIYIEHFKSVWDVALDDTFHGNDDLVELVKEHTKAIYYESVEDNARAQMHLALAKDEERQVTADFMADEIGDHVSDE